MPHPDDQAAGLRKLFDMAEPDWNDRERDYESRRAGWHRDRSRSIGRRNGDVRRRRQAVLAEREVHQGSLTDDVTPGALRDRYDIPTIKFDRREARGLFLTSIVVAGWVSYHLGWQSLALLACVAPGVAFRAITYVLSWFDKPATATAEVCEKLDRMHVTVAIPVYNEDAGLLDRCIYAIMNQTRPVDLIWVVDDGSKTDYSQVASYWTGAWSNGTEIRWTRQSNQGKRRAHAYVFERVPDTDIIVTVDSDTTLEHRAIEEGLKPFQSRAVQSVAGIEMGFNAYHNFLTRMQCSFQLFSQAVVGATWSVVGDMYTNRGPFALYRASLIREFLPVYRNETFFGRRVILGDDSLLALCASTRGRSVQQLTAYGLTMWPETYSHHLRQRLRWARGRAVRNFWRIRYRPMLSYCWWFTVSGIQAFLASTAFAVVLAATWPRGEPVLMRTLIALAVLSVPNGLRTLCFKRSDETLFDRIVLVIIRPIAAIWAGVMLARVLRVWGTLTLLKQGWTTRQKGAELVYSPNGTPQMAGRRTSAKEYAA
ncbi:MAG: glycosyltransferase [Streptosporangiaceae bacterium]